MGDHLNRRSTKVGIGAVGVAGIVGGLVVGAGVFANAAGVPTNSSSELSICANPPAPVPATPLFTKRFSAGGTLVSGTIPAPTSSQLSALNLNPTLVNVVVTTQYNTGRSGTGKTDIAYVTVPGHQYTNPLLFNIPPVTNSIVVGLGTVKYSVRTTGKAVASVTVSEFIGQATSRTPQVVSGSTCPTGTTKTGSQQTLSTQRPAAPTNVTAVPGGDSSQSATIRFTPSLNNGTQVVAYQGIVYDLTDPNAVRLPVIVEAPPANDTTTQQITVVSLTAGHQYQFQVVALSADGTPSSPSALTTPAIAPSTGAAKASTATVETPKVVTRQ